MYKKALILVLLILSGGMDKGFCEETLNASISVDYQREECPDIKTFLEKLPSFQKDFTSVNYSINIKNPTVLQDDDFILTTGINMPKGIKTNFQSIPEEYEISLSTGEIEEKNNSMEAVEYLIRKNPDNRDLLFAYAIQLKKDKKYEEALKSAQRAVEIDPNYALGHFLKGDILREMEKFKEAVEEYLYTTQINPYCADAYFNIAKILELLDDKELALD